MTLVTRSGSGPDGPGITRVAADASDPFALAEAAGTADALYNCANPPYHRWPELWPPMAVVHARGRRPGRRGARHHGQPLRLRAGGPPDDRGRPAGVHRDEGSGPGRHVARGARGRTGPGGSGSPRPGPRTSSAPGVADTSHFGRNVGPAPGRPEGPGPGRPRRTPLAGRTSPTSGAPSPPSAPTSGPGADRGTSRPAPAVSQRELATRFCAGRRGPGAVGRSLSGGVADGRRARVGPDARAEGDPLPVRPAVRPRLVGLHRRLRDRGDPARRGTARPWPTPPRAGRRCAPAA